MRYSTLWRAVLLVGLPALLLGTGPSARAATATATVSCEIVPAIRVTRAADLAFGRVQPGTSPGSVVLAPGGTRTAQGGVALPGGASAAAASFVVAGAPGASYAVTLPAGVAISNGAETMLVTGFTADALRGSLDASGARTVAIGATLHVNAHQAAGQYAGSLVIAVAYE